MDCVFINNKPITIFGKVNGNNEDKFNRAAKLANLFDRLETKFTNYLEDTTITKNKQASLACLMLMHTGVRVGNEDSAEGYITQPHPNQKDKQPEFVQTYGLTTLKKEHFTFKDNNVYLQFNGKKCVENTFKISHPVIYNWCENLVTNTPNNGFVFSITDSELTKFIKAYVGEQFSPKDFRCMKANIEAWRYVSTINEMFLNKANLKSQIKGLFTYVSTMLNNTSAVCRKSYVSPGVVDYLTTLCI